MNPSSKSVSSQSTLTIGALAKAAGVNPQTVRYYDRIGLLKPLRRRADSNYREYDAESLQRLRFVRRAQGLGFTLEEAKALLSLRPGPSSSSRQAARSKARTKLTEVREKLAALKRLERTLTRLVSDCEHGNDSAPCPILASLERGEA